MQAQIEKLIQDIKDNYAEFCDREDMVTAFNEGVTAKAGKKYVKILKKLGSQTMVWGFIVNVDDDKKFRKGDLLMAAGFNAPARNKPRGNILDGGYTIRWTGPGYLK